MAPDVLEIAARDDALVRALQRMRGRSLDGVEARQAVDEAEVVDVVERGDDGAGEGAAADLNDDAVERRARLAELRDDLPSERRPSFDGEAVLVPLTGERQRAGGDGLAELKVRRIAAAVLRPLARRDVRAEILELVDDARIGLGGDEDLERAMSGARDRRCRDGRVPAARDRQRPPRQRGIDPLRDAQPDHQSHQVPPLVRAADVRGLVLHPDAERRLPAERRDAKRQIEIEHELDELRVAHADLHGRVPRVRQPPEADERIRIVDDLRRAAEASLKHVIDVVAVVRTAERRGMKRGRAPAATGADDRGR